MAPPVEELGDPCGAVDAITGSICNVRVTHEIHKDETPDFTLTWAEPKVLIT